MSFATNGNSHVHLTGYLTDEQFDDDENVEEEEDEQEAVTAEKANSRKRKKETDLAGKQ